MSATAEAAAVTRARSRRRSRVRVLTYAAAGALALWVLVPLYLITLVAFGPPSAAYDYPKSLLPTELSTETVRFFVTSTGVVDSLVTSGTVALATVALSLLVGAPAGYGLARFVFKGKSAYRIVILSTRAFPVVILSIPLAVSFLQWGLYDTVWAVTIVHTALALPFTILITSSVFVAVPKELEEAAQILGCTKARAFVKVVAPLAVPGIAAAAIFTFVLSYNEIFAAVILTLENRTLPALVLSGLGQSPIPVRFAAAWFMVAPSLVFIFLIRRYLLGLWGGVTQ